MRKLGIGLLALATVGVLAQAAGALFSAATKGAIVVGVATAVLFGIGLILAPLVPVTKGLWWLADRRKVVVKKRQLSRRVEERKRLGYPTDALEERLRYLSEDYFRDMQRAEQLRRQIEAHSGLGYSLLEQKMALHALEQRRKRSAQYTGVHQVSQRVSASPLMPALTSTLGRVQPRPGIGQKPPFKGISVNAWLRRNTGR